jgi:hypothetical protein
LKQRELYLEDAEQFLWRWWSLEGEKRPATVLEEGAQVYHHKHFH